jgi:hypothetical protein
LQPEAAEAGAADQVGTPRAYLPDIAVRLCGALLALAIAAAHVADQGGVTKMADGWIGWGYRLIEIGAILTAIVMLVPWPTLLAGSASSKPALAARSAELGWAAGVLLGIVPFISYIATRTVGLPGDSADVGNWGDWLGTLSLFVEAAMVTLSIAVVLAIWQSARSTQASAGQLRLGAVRQPAASSESELPQ